MQQETIVAVFDSAAQAEQAARDLEAARIDTAVVSRQPDPTAQTQAPVREQGFWNSLFGGEPYEDAYVYDRSVASGSHVVTVTVNSEGSGLVADILERHHPVDLDERAAAYRLGETHATTQSMAGDAASASSSSHGPDTSGASMRTTSGALPATEEKLQLAEEQVKIGKRLVNRGTTRIRRFVVETPVQEEISLHAERVSIERRPVAGSDTSGSMPGTAFTESVIEIAEFDEEVVISKTARVHEELVVRRDSSHRVETVHETVRREDVEITRHDDAQLGMEVADGSSVRR